MTDIIYIRMHEGWLYLAVVIDLCSRMAVGWSMGQRTDIRLALDALTMALWGRQPKQPVLVHSDQDCQFTGHEWRAFLRHYNLINSMSRRANCHHNAVADSFLQSLKRGQIERRIYDTRQDARPDFFNYIAMLYNPTRLHSTAAGLSPVEFKPCHSPRRGCQEKLGRFPLTSF